MNEQKRLEIRNKCFSVHRDSGCFYIRAPEKSGFEHILCVEGDRRVLVDAFDEYVACDVFEHYVLCRDINYLSGQTAGPFTSDDILNKEIQFVYKNTPDTGSLQIQTGETVATVTTSVTQLGDTKQFSLGDDNNTITFNDQGTKDIVVNGRVVTVTFISFESAVYTIDKIFKLGFPDGAIGGLDDISGEMVLQDHPPESALTALVDEVLGEVVFENPVVIGGFYSLIEELLGELVIVDNHVDLAPPKDVEACVGPPPKYQVHVRVELSSSSVEAQKAFSAHVAPKLMTDEFPIQTPPEDLLFRYDMTTKGRDLFEFTGWTVDAPLVDNSVLYPDWNSNSTYAANTFVTYESYVWRALLGSNRDRIPKDDSNYWERVDNLHQTPLRDPIASDLTITANFTVKSVSMHLVVEYDNTLNPFQKTYDYEISINGDSIISNNLITSYMYGHSFNNMTDGLTDYINSAVDVHTAYIPAFSDIQLGADFTTSQTTGFKEWSIWTSENPDEFISYNNINTSVVVNGLTVIILKTGSPPLPNIQVKTPFPNNGVYYDTSVDVYDVSRVAPGSSSIVSTEIETSPPLSAEIIGHSLSLYKLPADEAASIKVTNPGSFLDFTKSWGIFIDFENTADRTGGEIMHRASNVVSTGNQTSYINEQGDQLSANFSIYVYDTRSGSVGGNNTWKELYRKFIIYCDGETVWIGGGRYTPGEQWTKSFTTTSSASLSASDGSLYIGRGMVDYISPYTDNKSMSMLIHDVAFIDHLPDEEQIQDFIDNGVSAMTTYDSLYDHIKCGSKTYPDMSGEKGNIIATLDNGHPDQIKPIRRYQTVPFPIDGTQFDLNITCVNQLNITKTVTRSYQLSAAPLDPVDLHTTLDLTTADGLQLLAMPVVASITTRVSETFGTQQITLTGEYI